MLKIGTLFLLLIGAVFSEGFLFPDQVSFKTNDDRSNLNSYDSSYTDHGHRQTFGRDDRHRPPINAHYNGNQGEFTSGYNHHGGNFHQGNRQNQRPHFGGIVSQGNAQSSGFGSYANSQSGSQLLNGGSQSNSQAQSQAYQSYPYGPNGGGASSASSAASASAGIVDGVATASAAAAAASASSGYGGSSSSSSSSSSTAGGSGNGQNPPWFYRTRIAGEDADDDPGNATATSATSDNNDKLIFSHK